MAFSPAPRLYFAYGSSLSTSEMKSQCPTSTFHGIAVLRNHRWFVNERGLANIIPSVPGANGTEDVVWGILYTLRPSDEELLDKHEGRPWASSKADMDVETVSITEDGRGTRREVVRALVYIDRERIQESYPWPEFVVKMNKGIQEAAERGLPGVWISRVVRSYIADPSTLSATEGEPEPEAGPPVHNGALPAALPAPAPRPESEHASQKQESVVEVPLVNGGSQKASSTQTNQPRGLQSSKYAYESMSNTSGASRRKAKEVATTQKTPSGPQARGNKQLECWWWKVKGSCRFPDNQCAYAHHITGFVSEAPGSQKKGSSFEKKDPPAHVNSVPRREKNPPFNPGTANENPEHPYGYKQDWSGGQNHGDANPRPGEQQSTADVNPSWGEQPGKTEAKPSWSDQVENLMDSEPDWLVANDRKDVKW